MPVDSLVVALVFSAVFLFGARIPRLASQRAALSVGAGVSTAYVFMRMLPELSEAQHEFVTLTLGWGLPAPGFRVYTAALAGFLAFYGLARLVAASHARPGRHGGADAETSGLVAWLHFGGFALYVALVSYMLVHTVLEPEQRLALYSVAMGLHFLGVERTLQREHPTAFPRIGRFMLAAASLAGWGIAALTRFSEPVVITALGFVSGGVVMNSMVEELPSEADGRFGPFVLGAVAYAIVLVSLE